MRLNGVDVTSTAKKLPVLRYVNSTVEFRVAMPVGTFDASTPAWTKKLSNVMLYGERRVREPSRIERRSMTRRMK